MVSVLSVRENYSGEGLGQTRWRVPVAGFGQSYNEIKEVKDS